MSYLEVYRLANIKSAKKRILVNETKAARNKAIKSKVKTAVKKVDAAIAAKDAEAAKTALHAAIVEISKAGTKGVYHKRTVSRKISVCPKLLTALLNHRRSYFLKCRGIRTVRRMPLLMSATR